MMTELNELAVALDKECLPAERGIRGGACPPRLKLSFPFFVFSTCDCC